MAVLLVILFEFVYLFVFWLYLFSHLWTCRLQLGGGSCVAGDNDGDCDDEDEGGCSGCDDGGDIEVDGNGHSDSAGDDNTAT